MLFTTIIPSITHFFVRNSTKLCAIGAVVSITAAVATTGYATRAATSDQIREDQFREMKQWKPMTKLEVIKARWFYYILPAIFTVASIVLTIGGYKMGVARELALAGTVATLQESANIRDNIVRSRGTPDDDVQLNSAVAERRGFKQWDDNQTIEGSGDLFFDEIFGGWWRSTKPKIEIGVARANTILASSADTSCSVSELRAEIGAPAIKACDHIFFERHKTSDIIEVRYTPIEAPNGEAALAISYRMGTDDTLGIGAGGYDGYYHDIGLRVGC